MARTAEGMVAEATRRAEEMRTADGRTRGATRGQLAEMMRTAGFTAAEIRKAREHFRVTFQVFVPTGTVISAECEERFLAQFDRVAAEMDAA